MLFPILDRIGSLDRIEACVNPFLVCFGHRSRLILPLLFVRTDNGSFKDRMQLDGKLWKKNIRIKSTPISLKR